MKSSIAIIMTLSSMMFFSFTTSPFVADFAPWKHIGTKAVNFSIDKDYIPVGVSEGRFEKLKVEVIVGNLHMHKMLVTFGDGSQKEIALKHNFKKGSSSRVIDLPGGKRVIKGITFLYDTRKHSNHKAVVKVFGKK